MKMRTKAWINLVLLIVTLGVNTLGATGYINGLSQKEISDRYLTLITPSPSTFSIWGLIYSLLFISMIVMILKAERPYYRDMIGEISTLYIVSCIFNALWIVLFSFEMVAISVVFIAGLLVTLTRVILKLNKEGGENRLLLPLTFGLYTGWLFIATVVNIAAALVKLEWNGFGIDADIWSIITLIVAIILVVLVGMRLHNAVFPLPIAWAYYGIGQFLKAPEGFQGAYGMLENTAMIGAALLVLFALVLLVKNRYRIIGR